MKSQIEVMEMGEVWIARCKLAEVSAIGKTRDDAIRAIVEMTKVKTEIEYTHDNTRKDSER